MKNRLFIVLALALLGATSVYAKVNPDKEITTALNNAKQAEQMHSVQHVRLGLQHVINCLEGRKGVDYNAKSGNPCMGMGNGAINDFHGDRLNRDLLHSALEDAQYGQIIKRPQIAQNAASLAVEDLERALQ